MKQTGQCMICLMCFEFDYRGGGKKVTCDGQQDSGGCWERHWKKLTKKHREKYKKNRLEKPKKKVVREPKPGPKLEKKHGGFQPTPIDRQNFPEEWLRNPYPICSRPHIKKVKVIGWVG